MEFSTIDSIDAVGIEYIKALKRTLPDLTFRISVLNERSRKPEEAFYPNFDIQEHGYNKFNYGYLGSLASDSTPNCLQDGDIISSAPLIISIDPGGNLNVALIGQHQGDTFRILKGFHVKPPNTIRDLASDIALYYEPHKGNNDAVRFIYDQTAVGKTATSNINAADEFMSEMRKKGWRIIDDYRGSVPSHNARFIFLDNLLKGEYYPRVPKIQLNKYHCDNLIIGLETTKVKIGRNGYEKDKTDERNKNIPQEKTTHYPDAFDSMAYHLFNSQVDSSDVGAVDMVLG
jgi:hypothetical protein